MIPFPLSHLLLQRLKINLRILHQTVHSALGSDAHRPYGRCSGLSLDVNNVIEIMEMSIECTNHRVLGKLGP